MKTHVITISITFLTILSLAGCSTLSSSANKKFTKAGLPHQRYLIGGGFDVDYDPQVKGTAYWVEENTQKILATETIEAGEEISFYSNDFEGDYSILIEKAKLSLYFIPSTELP